MLAEADLVLAMSPRRVVRRFAGASEAYLAIFTPYRNVRFGVPPNRRSQTSVGFTMIAFLRASVRQLLECVEGLVERLER
jgi:hypothetical protein